MIFNLTTKHVKEFLIKRYYFFFFLNLNWNPKNCKCLVLLFFFNPSFVLGSRIGFAARQAISFASSFPTKSLLETWFLQDKQTICPLLRSCFLPPHPALLCWVGFADRRTHSFVHLALIGFVQTFRVHSWTWDFIFATQAKNVSIERVPFCYLSFLWRLSVFRSDFAVISSLRDMHLFLFAGIALWSTRRRGLGPQHPLDGVKVFYLSFCRCGQMRAPKSSSATLSVSVPCKHWAASTNSTTTRLGEFLSA